MTTLDSPPATDTGFVALRVARVDALTSDSVALTFEVPPEQAERFRFAPGQHLTLRRVLDGGVAVTMVVVAGMLALG